MTAPSRDNVHANRVRLGKLLEKYNGRILGGIRMIIDKSGGHPSRYRYHFVKVEDEPRVIRSDSTYRPPSWEQILKDNPEPGGIETIPEEGNKGDNPPFKSFVPLETAPLENPKVCQSVSHVSQTPLSSTLKNNYILSPERTYVSGEQNIINFKGSTGRDLTVLTDRLTTSWLALDIETYATSGSGGGGKKGPKHGEKDALRPWSGAIRLITLTDEAGNITQIDLQKEPFPEHLRYAIEKSTLIAHNAAFDLLFLAVHLGIYPAGVWCTYTASRLLTNGTLTSCKLGDVMHRHLGITMSKELGRSDWGGFLLTDEQFEYAKNDVRYLFKLKEVLSAELEKADLTRIFELECALIPVVVRMEQAGVKIYGKTAGDLRTQYPSSSRA
jgi:ribonuclease D